MIPAIVIADPDHPIIRDMVERIVRDAVLPSSRLEELIRFAREELQFTVHPLAEMQRVPNLPGDSPQIRARGAIFMILCASLGLPTRQRAMHVRPFDAHGVRRPPNNARARSGISNLQFEVNLDGRWRKVDLSMMTARPRHRLLAAVRERLQDASTLLALLMSGPWRDLLLVDESFERI